jgi:hypothetical protein
MNATAIRRYLQPSPTLRWHPWAPLVSGLILVALVFVLGAQWGYSAAKRDSAASGYGEAFLTRMEQKSRFPARDLVRKAAIIDAAVMRYVRESQHEVEAWEKTRNEAERWLFHAGRKPYVLPRQSIADLAEFRLSELGGTAAAWQVTSSYCEEMHPPLTGYDLRQQAAADAYSTLLGRTISPEQLAPAVPNARCEPRRVQ